MVRKASYRCLTYRKAACLPVVMGEARVEN
jgi:hypothetical protein